MSAIWSWLIWLFRSPFGQAAAEAATAVLTALGKEAASLLSEYAKKYVAEAEKVYGPGNGEIKFEAVKQRLIAVAVREGLPRVEWAIDKIAQDAATALQADAAAKKEK